MSEKSDGNQKPWQFKKGQSGNPNGKPKGARHAATLAAEALLDGEAEALTRKAIEKALEGDGVALRLCLERIIPARRDRPVSFAMPTIENAADAARAFSAILQAVADGSISPSDAQAVTGLLEGYIKALEASEFEARLSALETAKEQR